VLIEPIDPYFYIPRKDFIDGALKKLDPSTKKCYWLARLSAGGKSTERVLSFDPAGTLENLVRVEVSSIGRWSVLEIGHTLIVIRSLDSRG